MLENNQAGGFAETSGDLEVGGLLRYASGRFAAEVIYGFLARPDAGAQASHAGRGGAGQQDGAHRLGADEEEGILQGACAGHLSGGRANIAGRNASRSEDSVGANGHRDGIRQTRDRTESFQARVIDMGPILASPYGPAASETPQSGGRIHECTGPHRAELFKTILAILGASIPSVTTT